MKNFFQRFKLTILYIIFVFLLGLIISIIEYIGAPYGICSTILCILNFILLFIYALLNGKKSYQQGYKSGIRSFIKVGSFLLVLNIISFNGIGIKMLVYYLIILILSIAGGILGKNMQKKLS